MSTLLHKSFILNHNFKYLTKKIMNKSCLEIVKKKSIGTFYMVISNFSSDQSKIENEKDIKETKTIKKDKIEPTVYNNDPSTLPIDDEEFGKKFWEAYEKKMKDQQEIYRPYPDRIRYKKAYHNPIERAFGVVKDDILEYFGKLKHNSVLNIRPGKNSSKSPGFIKQEESFPSYCDVVIIGGGLVGTSIAYHLQERAKDGLKIVVIEKDMSYSKASTVLSVGGIRQQFSTPENIILSKYGMDFLQQAENKLTIDDNEPVKMDVTFNGYLTLATEKGYPQMLENYNLQLKHNSFVEMLSKEKLKRKFPWIETDNIVAGVHGTQREGWFDPWSLLLAMNRKAKTLGTEFVNGSVISCDSKNLGDYVLDPASKPSVMKQLSDVEVALPDGETRIIKCAVCVIAAGAWSKEVGMMCGIGTEEEGIRAVPIPVEPRKRFVYCVKVPDGPGLNCPLVIDPNKSYFRREGLADLYLCGRSPEADEEPSVDDLSVDYSYFEEKVWPSIAERCKKFENLKVQSAWAGYYDYNTFDQNAIIGRHPSFSNLYIATGFSGHGIQQAAGAGKALTELIVDSEFKTLDMERFGFDRILLREPIFEQCVY
ncbi:UNVERIFIED_CONTAM: hypothetical protein GTU68_004491 [Idotea baltica]|nr:hypothetical protein [Idotea baltica]